MPTPGNAVYLWFGDRATYAANPWVAGVAGDEPMPEPAAEPPASEPPAEEPAPETVDGIHIVNYLNRLEAVILLDATVITVAASLALVAAETGGLNRAAVIAHVTVT